MHGPDPTGGAGANGGWFKATYQIASYLPLPRVAEILAGEQSYGTFITVAGASEALRERHGARVTSIQETGYTTAVLPGSYNPEALDKARVGLAEVEFPEINVGSSLVSLLNTVAGNLYELRELAAVKLVDLEIPGPVMAAYPGPVLGVQGTRDLIGRHSAGALIGTIVKPSIGLPLDELGVLVRTLARAGIDFIKDDEVNGNPPSAPLADRIKVVMPEIERAADVTGKKVMYAFNCSDDFDTMLRNADLVDQAGGTCVMLTIPTVGLPAVRAVRERTGLAIHGHRAGFGALARSESIGMSFAVYQKLARLCGADHLHVGGVNSKFYESNSSVLASVLAIQAPLGGFVPTLPVLSSAQSAATAEAAYELIGSDDLLVLAGGGISGHPSGPAAGVESMKMAWEAVRAGRDVHEAAAGSDHLRQALEYFGSRT